MLIEDYSRPDAVVYHATSYPFDLQPVTPSAYKLLAGLPCDERGAISLNSEEDFATACDMFDSAGLYLRMA